MSRVACYFFLFLLGFNSLWIKSLWWHFIRFLLDSVFLLLSCGALAFRHVNVRAYVCVVKLPLFSALRPTLRCQ